jgi:hypothetical protein
MDHRRSRETILGRITHIARATPPQEQHGTLRRIESMTKKEIISELITVAAELVRCDGFVPPIDRRMTRREIARVMSDNKRRAMRIKNCVDELRKEGT